MLHRALEAAHQELLAGVRDALTLQSVMRAVFQDEPLAAIEYAEIVDAETFEPVTRISRVSYALLAAFIGKTRLIDNLYLEPVGDTGDFTFHL